MKIVRVERFQREIQNLPGDCSRLEAALLQLEATLKEKPDGFPVIIGDERRQAKLTPFPGVPPINILYRIDGEQLFLMSAELYESLEDSGN
jgi:hypothetical protein